MLDQLKELEQQARELEPEEPQRRQLSRQVEAYAEAFYRELPEAKTYIPDYQTAGEVLDTEFDEEPADLDPILKELRKTTDRPGINTASGGHIGYIPGGGLFTSALGDYLAAVTNRYAGVHYTSPGAVNIERRLIRWMADLTGYPDTAGGYLASGGSIANLTAIITAREAVGLHPVDYEKTVVYVSGQTHHCIDRALRIAGMAVATQRFIPVDEKFRMDTDALEEAIKEDMRAGLKPWMIVGTAGTTDTGAVDPLRRQGDLAEKFGLWFHVDAAYGGFFLLVDELKPMFDGIQLSDSVVLDPHKGLFLPYGIGAVILKDERLMAGAYSYEASYMQDIQERQTVLSPADTSPELSKHFRGLRMWLPLKLHGISAFRSALKEKYLLARYAREKLAAIKDIETGPEPDLSVTLFRYLPKDGDPEECNQRLHQYILDDGRVYLSSTRIDGKYMLRVAVLSVRTHINTIEVLSEVVKQGIAHIRQ